MAYIGQSSNLKDRLGALKSVYGEMPPRHTPHFAAPALWTWRQARPHGLFLVSVAPFPTVPKPLRLGLECLAIALHRQEQHSPPLANFGRTYEEWQVLWQLDAALQAHAIGPTGPLTGEPHAESWCGLRWTPWTPVQKMQVIAAGQGLYRLRVPDCDSLMVIGQGKVGERLKPYRAYHHLDLHCSWSLADWPYHRRLDLVSDAVGAHLLTRSALPLWQFEQLGPRRGPEATQTAA